jgi:hypothetical protein
VELKQQQQQLFGYAPEVDRPTVQRITWRWQAEEQGGISAQTTRCSQLL